MAYDTLIFVYNADSGVVGALLDSVHKVVSPDTYACNLCGLTYGLVSMARPWRRFLDSLPLSTRFLHRDEIEAAHPDLNVVLPAILLASGNDVHPLMTADEINDASELSQLIARLSSKLEDAGITL